MTGSAQLPARSTQDRRRETKEQIHAFSTTRRAELEYARKLRAVAKNVGAFIRGLFPGGEPAAPDALGKLHATMRAYAEALRPWAEATANRMLADVSRRDVRAWAKVGERMERAVEREVRATPVGDVVRDRLAAQVKLITSLPVDAANRVHELTLKGLTGGTRASEIAAEIARSGDVTASRATLIARTEVGRTATEFTRARALRLGSTGYIWRTARDRDVRHVHRELEGTFHGWNDPPVAMENGTRAHPGSSPNCRCWAEPVLPDFIA